MPFLVVKGILAADVIVFARAQVHYGLLLFSYLLLQLAYLVDYLVEFLLSLQQLSTDLARTDLRIQQFLVLLLYFFDVLLVFDLQLMEVDEFKFFPHLLFFCYLVGCFYYLGRQGGFLVFVLFN